MFAIGHHAPLQLEHCFSLREQKSSDFAIPLKGSADWHGLVLSLKDFTHLGPGHQVPPQPAQRLFLEQVESVATSPQALHISSEPDEPR
eukprot:Skav223438  [mRNA]  locus=scaffold350:614112:615184:- [translate_table: standard]